jgi:hypothetical protein
LLNEAKIKDNLADIRIAGLEEDWHGKVKRKKIISVCSYTKNKS